VRPVRSLGELAELIDLSHMSHSSSRFDEAELKALSQKTLHQFSFADVASRLAELGVTGPLSEPFWLAVRGNLSRLSDAVEWWTVAFDGIAPRHEDAALLKTAAELLPAEPWGGETWRQWTKQIGAATGLKGRDLYHPLRLALTGRESGPELALLLPLIGRARASDRLSAPSA
jgi:glutamyl-tRNA synthetase